MLAPHSWWLLGVNSLLAGFGSLVADRQNVRPSGPSLEDSPCGLVRRSARPSRRAFIGSSLWHQRYRFPQQIWLADYRAIRQLVESFLRLVIVAVFLPPYLAAGRIKRRTSSRGGDDHYLLPVSTGPACQYSGAMRSCAPVILLVPSSPPRTPMSPSSGRWNRRTIVLILRTRRS